MVQLKEIECGINWTAQWQAVVINGAEHLGATTN
jgi:hypothetical protein